MTDQKHKTPRVCKNCACFDPLPRGEFEIEQTDIGLCRSESPRLDISRGATDAVWPRVAAVDWCVNGYKAALVPRRNPVTE